MTTPTKSSDTQRPNDIIEAVQTRYAEGATTAVPELCCPVDYDPALLKVIPKEVIERDYGCGDPSKWLLPGETVLDLGSGTGKICFIASQVVGVDGHVLGVDMTDDMLEVARRNAPLVAKRIGYSNVTFLKGRIEDLTLDREVLDARLQDHPVGSEEDLAHLETWIATERVQRPLVADDSVDVVVSNCVLNLVAPARKRRLFDEIFRVLKRGGRAVISDIVSDEEVPAHMAADPDLWTGCISGAFQEDAFLEAFEEAGFYGIEVVSRGSDPWHVVEGIEFRSVTVRAWKGKQGACREQGHAVLYKGPWSVVVDDDGHEFPRGVPMAVCGKTYGIMTKGPYAAHVVGLEPSEPVADEDAGAFSCDGSRRRSAAELKGAANLSSDGDTSCEPGECC
jgi:arsenite methyltransferase